MNTDDTDKNGLARMDADERGLNNGARQIEWSPTPDMYRTDTPEGREAYEACLRKTMAPRVGAERRPPQPVIPPQPAQKPRGPGAPVIAPENGAETHYSALRDERLPKGPLSASEPLDADTGAGSVLRPEPYAVLG
jgi:hypothetical protein